MRQSPKADRSDGSEEKSDIVDYFDTPLIRKEAEVMIALHEQIGRIPRISTKRTHTFGFVSRNNHVIQLNILSRGLTFLPENFGDLGSLEILRLNGNRLSSLPASFENLTSLEKLVLEKNQLLSLDSFPHHIPNLYYLDCSYNRLTKLPTLPVELPKIKQINFSRNALTSLHGLPQIIHISPIEREREEQMGEEEYDDEWHDYERHDYERYYDGDGRLDTSEFGIMVKINVASNYLENLAGILPIQANNIGKALIFVYQGLMYKLGGNPLRSFHGIPKQDLFLFTAQFGFGQQYAPPENVNRNSYEEIRVMYIRTFFFLSHTGATLLDECVEENNSYREQLGDIEDLEFVQQNFLERAPPSWHQAHEVLYEYYRYSPLELAHQYLVHNNSENFSLSQNNMSKEAIDRLRYEGGRAERQLLEKELLNPQVDPVLQAIQTRLSVTLPNGHTILL
jgi:Leucine-rich repeat (LRR) protein